MHTIRLALSRAILSNQANFTLPYVKCPRFKNLYPMKPETLQMLLTRTMPYGKYKDRLLADLPGHYLGWFARNDFPTGELGSLLSLMYELDHNALRHLLDPLRSKQKN